MADVLQSVAGVALCFSPCMANIDMTMLTGCLQNGAYGVGAGILVWQLIKAYRRNDQLQQKNLELTERMLNKCGQCRFVQESNELARMAHKETMERITGDFTPQEGRLQ